MKHLILLAAIAVITPVRRGLSYVEGRLVHAEHRIRYAGALFIVLTLAVGCAPWQARRTIADQRAECRAAYARATTDAEAHAIHERCDAAHESVREDKPEKTHGR